MQKRLIRPFFILIAIVVVGCNGRASIAPAESNENTTFEIMSENDDFFVVLKNDNNNVTINELHTWTLTVFESDRATVVEDASIVIDGGMPEHNHGFPTEPSVSTHLGEGSYLVEGIKFQMGGNWEMKFTIDAGGKTDVATFNISVPN